MRSPASSRWTTSARSRAAPSGSQRFRSRSGPGCEWRVRRPGGRGRRPGCRCPRCCAPGRGCRPGSAAAPRSGLRLAVLEPEPVLAALLEQGRSEAEGQGQSGGGQPERLAGVSRRAVVRQSCAAPDRRAGRHLGRRSGPGLQQGDQLGAGVGGDVEGSEVQPVLGRGEDAGLVLAVEGVGRVAGSARRVRLGPPYRESADAGPDRECSRAGDSEEPRRDTPEDCGSVTE